MYYLDWPEFAKAAEALLRQQPERTRCVTKYRHDEGLLVLKVTNDKVCLKFKTDQAQDVKKVDKFYLLVMEIMAAHHAAA